MIQADCPGLSKGRLLLRTICFIPVLALFVLAASCAKFAKVSDQSIPKLLTPIADAEFDQLTAKLRAFINVQAMRSSRVTIQFLDAESTERYRTADASLVLKRPDNIRLIIQVPTVGTKIAEMVSDSQHFRVAIYRPEQYRSFLIGSNNADYTQWRERLSKKAEQQSALVNARPFHFTDALLVHPLHLDEAKFIYSRQQELIEEFDARKGAKPGARVLRSFYVISESELIPSTPGRAKLRRRFWFDRNNQTQLSRQQVFDEQGRVVTDANYSNYLKLSAEGADLWPSVIKISRPYDKYSAVLTFLPESVEYNPADLPAAAFVLENKEKLPQTDLDQLQP